MKTTSRLFLFLVVLGLINSRAANVTVPFTPNPGNTLIGHNEILTTNPEMIFDQLGNTITHPFGNLFGGVYRTLTTEDAFDNTTGAELAHGTFPTLFAATADPGHIFDLLGVTTNNSNRVHLSFTGYTLDMSAPSDYLYNTTTGLEVRTYRNGKIRIFEEVGAAFNVVLGYDDAVGTVTINYTTGVLEVHTISAVPFTDGGMLPAIPLVDLPSDSNQPIQAAGATTEGRYGRYIANNMSMIFATEALSVTLAPSLITERETSTATVIRTGPLVDPVTVRLSNNDATEVTHPATVTIPTGMATADFTITAIDDMELDAAQSVIITATAAGFTAGSATLGVNDRLPSAMDFGDAPHHPTLLVHDGARHEVGGPRLGAAVDTEDDGQPATNASGDDLTPPGSTDDEDGVTFSRFVANSTATITVDVQVAAGKLDAWIDWNRDGDWADAGEQIAASMDVGVGQHSINTLVPSISTTGTNFARFRLSTAGGLLTTGAAIDGEVEDHVILITANANPVAVPDLVHALRDIQLMIPISIILANDTDADGDQLSASPFTSTIRGGLVMPSGDNILYTPPTGFIGVDEFEYSLNDPFGGFAMGRVVIRVSGTTIARFQELNLMPASTGNDIDVRFAGEASAPYQIQVSTDLNNWSTAATVTSGADGSINFQDANAKIMSRRYYRILQPASP